MNYSYSYWWVTIYFNSSTIFYFTFISRIFCAGKLPSSFNYCSCWRTVLFIISICKIYFLFWVFYGCYSITSISVNIYSSSFISTSHHIQSCCYFSIITWIFRFQLDTGTFNSTNCNCSIINYFISCVITWFIVIIKSKSYLIF